MQKKVYKILLIDDDDFDKKHIQRALNLCGLKNELSFASDIKEGLALASANHFDCILLDFRLPDGDGFSFLKKYHDRGGNAPVVIITAQGDDFIEDESVKYGACDYIFKSTLTPESVSQSIRCVTRLAHARSHLNHTQKSLVETERRLETVISNAPLIFFTLNHEGIFTYIKGKGADVLNVNVEEITGQSVYNTSGKLPIQPEDFERAIKGNEFTQRIEFLDNYFEITYTPVSENDIINCVIGVAADITGYKKAENELMNAVQVAQEASRIKEMFLANMSHEIRTPIHGIIGLADILSKAIQKADNRTYIDAIKQSADNLLVIINDVLDISKIEAGKMTFEQTDFSFREVLKCNIDLFMPKANEKCISLEYEINDTVPSHLRGDPVRLSQVVNNLLSNAVKFTHKGKVSLTANVAEQSEKSILIEFRIKDSGIGIKPQKLRTIFETFSQGGDDIARKYGGTGLGLSIVKKIIDLQCGTISVQSKSDSGTEFTFSLPFEISNGQMVTPPAQQNEPEEKFETKSLRILVVEDNEINRLITNKLFHDWNCQLDNASNGNEAIERIKENHYDLVLMDVEMPEMNGVQATEYIRKKLSSPKNAVPILAASAHINSQERERCLNAGMNDYISKPFNPSDLKRKIMETIKGTTPSGNIPEAVLTQASPAEATRVTNLSFLKSIAENNPSFFKEFIEMFLQNAPEMLSSLSAQAESGDWESAKQTAHKLKPSVNYLGMKEIQAACEKIEEIVYSKAGYDEIPSLSEKIINTCKAAFTELEEEIRTFSA